MKKKRFSLSSSIGFLRVGGWNSFDTTNVFGQGPIGTVRVEAYLDYISFNTLAQYQLEFHGTNLVFGLGPRLDVVVNMNDAFEGIGSAQGYNPVSVGLVARAKIIKNFGLFFGGIGIDYHHNFIPVADWPATRTTTAITNLGGSIKTQTALFNAYFGYQLKWKAKEN